MKLKSWLVISHLTVMIAPILSAVLLYNLILNYNRKVEIGEYINAAAKFEYYGHRLDKPEIYIRSGEKNINVSVDEEDKDTLQIKLYNSSGQKIHFTDTDVDISYSRKREDMYSHLYEIVKNYNFYSLKRPVFYKNTLVGFYEIIIKRGEFIEQVNINTITAIICFTIIITIVFLLVTILMNKKFNTPIKLLVEGMNNFVEGAKKPIEYKSGDEIGELITHFNNMKNDIEEKKKIIDSQQKIRQYMISAVSHDLKTPLTSIRAYSESIYNQEELDLEKIRDRASVILNKSDYMKKMIDDLMFYTVLTSNYKMNFVEVWGDEFFEMLFSGYDESCQKNNIQLMQYIYADYTLKVDVQQMMRVVDNLMANAVKYTSEGGEISLGAFSAEEKIPSFIAANFREKIRSWKSQGCIISVQNQGRGIPKEEQNRIFMPFYQVDKSRNKTSKSEVGLGLSIVNLIIKKHEGEVKVFSDNKKTIFVCWIPIVSTELNN